MAEIASFRGILYDTEKAGAADRLLAPPYDVISEAERQKLLALSPHNCVRLILPEGEGDAKYETAGGLWRDWIAGGTLRRDERPALYRYHQTFTAEGVTTTRKGFIARLRLARFSEGVVLPHERTLAGPKMDRLKLMRATRAHFSQIFGLYSDPERATDLPFEAVEGEAPALVATTADGVTQRLWKLTDVAAQQKIYAILREKKIYIADGHHRYETMLTLRDELRAQHPSAGPNSAIEFGTMFLANMDDPGLLVFPTHRVVHGLQGFDLPSLLGRAKEFFTVEETAMAEAAAVRGKLAALGEKTPSFAIATAGRLAYLSLRKDVSLDGVMQGPKVVQGLDVTVLHALVLENILGIDRAAQEKQTNLRYVKDTGQALAEASAPGVQAVFVMNPTKVSQVKAVSDAGEVMPQKSTYFYPKLASGLVMNPIEASEQV